MEKEKSNYNLENLARYRPAAVAAKFYQEKNETAAKGALEKLVNTLDVGKDGPVLLKAIKEGNEGNQILTSIYSSEYQKVLMSAKVKDLFNFYSDYFKEYIIGDSYEEAVRVFEQYSNEDYKNMLDKVIESQEIINSKRPNLTEEDKKKAEDTLNKYQKIVLPIQSFEQLEIDNLSAPIGKDALKKDLTEMFKPTGKSE